MPAGTAGQLLFAFRDLVEEIQILQDISSPLIDSRFSHVLRQLGEDLEGLWDAAAHRAFRWELREIRTVVSEGEYEPGSRRGARRVAASVSGTWDVRPEGPSARKPKERQKRLIKFSGIASTRVRFLDADDGASIGMWRMELGDANSPGCYFHVQVLGDQEAPPFPKSVSVPRLPSLFVTPMGAIEYVLGELFQDRWAKIAAESTGNVQRWIALQKRRLMRLLDWQRATVEKSLMSPWMALKAAKPEPDMFLPP